MSRIGFLPFLALGLIGVASSDTRSDDTPKPESKAQAVDRILTEWHGHASKVISLQVAFQSTVNTPGFGKEERAGTLYLAMPNLALVDFQEIDAPGETTSQSYRYAWTDRSTYVFKQPEHFVTRLDFPEATSRPPKFLSIYFLFGMTVDQAKTDHDWEIVNEDDSKVILIALDKNRGKKTAWFKSFDKPRVESFYVTLDKRSYQPKVVALLPEGSVDYRKNGTIYFVTDLRVNPNLDRETMKSPPISDFKLMENKVYGQAPKTPKHAEDAINQKR
jgi:hypothetical protein